MATKFYFSPDAGGASPAYSAFWLDESGENGWPARRSMITAHGDDASAEEGIYYNNTNERMLPLGGYVSGQWNAHDFTTSETLKLQIRAYNGVGNAYVALSVRVCSANGATIRGTLYEGHGATLITTGSLQNRSLGAAGAAVTIQNNVSMLAGDRLVVELGAAWSSATYSTAAMYLYNDQTGDLPEDETSTSTAHNPWVELSATLVAYNPAAENNVLFMTFES